MAKPRRLIPPVGGISDRPSFTDTPGLVVPPGAMENVEPFDTAKGHERIGSRPALAKLFPTQIGGGAPVQWIGSISKAAVTTGYRLGGAADAMGTWESRASGVLAGNFFLLSRVPSMFRDFNDTAGGGAKPVVAARWHPTATHPGKAVYLLNYNDGTRNVCRVVLVDDMGSTLWSYVIEDLISNADASGNTCWIDDSFVYVAFTFGVQVLNATTGAFVRLVQIDGWGAECIDVRGRGDGQILVAFNGAGFGATLANGQVVNNGMYRSGIALYSPGCAARVPFGVGLAAGVGFYEANHGTLRISEQSVQAPNGCWVTCLSTGPDNSVYCSRTNQGWGPNGSFPPGSVAYVSVFRADSTGRILWEADTLSFRRAYTGWWGTLYNDIPNSAGQLPTLLALDADPLTGDCYAAGQVDAALGTPFNVFKLRGADGTLAWTYSTTATVRWIKVDPTDSNLWVAMDRNSGWVNAAGASGTNALLLKLSAASGLVIASYDLNTAVSGLAVDVDSRGFLALGTDHF